MIEICPAILTDSKQEFDRQLKEYVSLFKQIDIDFNLPNDSFMGKNIVEPEYAALSVTEYINKKMFGFHFMIERPFEEINKVLKIIDKESYKNLKIYIHQESSFKLDDLLNLKNLEIHAGICIQANSKLLKPDFYNQFQEIQLMTVEIGYQGSEFLSEVLYRVEWLRENGYDGLISIDGGVDLRTAEIIKNFDIDRVSVGSYFSKSENVKLSKMKLELALNM